MPARLRQEHVDQGVIVLPGPRLELIPVDRRFDRVDMHVLQGWPQPWKHGGPGAGVSDLCSQHQIGSIVDKQSEASILFDQARQRMGINRNLLYLGVQRSGSEGGRKNGDRSRIQFHLFYS